MMMVAVAVNCWWCYTVLVAVSAVSLQHPFTASLYHVAVLMDNRLAPQGVEGLACLRDNYIRDFTSLLAPPLFYKWMWFSSFCFLVFPEKNLWEQVACFSHSLFVFAFPHRHRIDKYLDTLLANQPISDGEATDRCKSLRHKMADCPS